MILHNYTGYSRRSKSRFWSSSITPTDPHQNKYHLKHSINPIFYKYVHQYLVHYRNKNQWNRTKIHKSCSSAVQWFSVSVVDRCRRGGGVENAFSSFVTFVLKAEMQNHLSHKHNMFYLRILYGSCLQYLNVSRQFSCFNCCSSLKSI